MLVYRRIDALGDASAPLREFGHDAALTLHEIDLAKRLW
jgi:hypothetical protein